MLLLKNEDLFPGLRSQSMQYFIIIMETNIFSIANLILNNAISQCDINVLNCKITEEHFEVTHLVRRFPNADCLKTYEPV